MTRLDRAQFLRLGATGALGAAGAGLVATGTAAAALPKAVPAGDDIAFAAFAVVAERVSLAFYRDALGVKGWTRGERRRLALTATAKGEHIAALNAALGANQVTAEDFAATFPAASLASRDAALALGTKLEQLLVSSYLSGAAFAGDSSTRLLLGRLLTYDAQVLAWMRIAAGGLAATGLPVPIDLEAAGTELDAYLTTPSFPQ